MTEEGRTAHPALSAAQKLDWLRLLRSENVGPITFRALINRFGGAAEALEALPRLSAKGGLSRSIRICPREEAEREIAAAGRLGAELLAWGDAGYPPLLARVEDAPPLVYAAGDIAVSELPAVAIVGSRNCSAVGRRMAATIAAQLAREGFAVVSGLARGIDAAAHEASLGTGTIAVLAGGLGRLYPPEHAGLADAIRETGLLLTEMPPDWIAKAKDFPRRNRIISGVAYGVIVVEAAARSGTLITARFALEQGREVFAVPGSPLDPRAEGTNRLIRNGATLVRDADDVLETLRPMLGRLPPPTPLAEPEGAGETGPMDVDESGRRRVLDALSPTPTELDDIVRQTGLTPAQVMLVLIELELAGRIERHTGNRVSLS